MTAQTDAGQKPALHVSRWLFLRALALIYLVAFLSLDFQVKGLIGEHGILPVQDFLKLVRENIGPTRYWLLPTWFWLNAQDWFLQFVCIAGACLSVLLFFGFFTTSTLILLWTFYLSLLGVCRDFLAFQWDVLLLEAGFLAIFVTPPVFLKKERLQFAPVRGVIWLFRWLLFRLMFSSGIVKLLSGDPTWRHFTALRYHYETQPLPTWIGWYVHQLPDWFQSASVIVMFAVELIVPFLIFAPRRFRRFAFFAIVGLQVLILLTGNYCFFNLLTIALCFFLLEDNHWPAKMRDRLHRNERLSDHAGWSRWVLSPVIALIAVLSAIQMMQTVRAPFAFSDPLLKLDRVTQPFHLVSGYGLFSVMTTSRNEIIIEGSNDQQHWSAYEFKYKPGDAKQRPEFVAPHQPRLDWQMWFAALESYDSNRWFIPLCERLLEGSPDVLSLLEKNPFPGKPPQYVRAMIYQYHFSDLKTKAKDGAWWTRELLGAYSPVFSMRKR